MTGYLRKMIKISDYKFSNCLCYYDKFYINSIRKIFMGTFNYNKCYRVYLYFLKKRKYMVCG